MSSFETLESMDEMARVRCGACGFEFVTGPCDNVTERRDPESGRLRLVTCCPNCNKEDEE